MPTLQFKGKTVIETYHHTVPHHTLRFDRKLSVLEKGQDPSLDGNLIIEGDNLLALKALLPTHAGKVKCIYIDPPYNTGNEGWVYNDNLTQPQFKEWIGRTVGKEGEDFCRHDKWCCMMYPRLALLKELLREDGSIFVSIDDHELHRLRAIMDELFGEQNHLTTIVWKPRYSPPNDHKGIAAMHDFVVAYRKTDAFQRSLLPRSEQSEANYSNPDNDPRGDWLSVGYIGNKSRKERPNSWYGINRPKDGKEIWPSEDAVWRFAPKTHDKNVKEDRLYWGPEGLYDKPRFKRFRFEVREGVVPGSWWDPELVESNDKAKRELRDILGPDAFSNPKPTSLVERVLRIATEEGDIVLDSFAGSGTTGHAALQLSDADGLERRFVLIQQPFDTKDDEQARKNICREVTAERVRRVMNGYRVEGSTQALLLEEKVTLNVLKKPDEVLARMDEVKDKSESRYDSIKRECKDGFVRLIGEKKIKDKTPGLGGTFTYARLSENPLFNEYRDFGDKLPAYEDIAQYIFYTETSREFPGTDRRKNKAWDKKAGRIGQHPPEGGGRSYYLLYEPNRRHDKALDHKFLDEVAANDPNPELVVYCERIAVHRDELRAFERTTNKRVRTMLVPFELK